jgi:uncharacterized damage-inducible protein DinB
MPSRGQAEARHRRQFAPGREAPAPVKMTFTSEETVTYYGAKELAESFRTVRKNTIKIAEEVPEDKYDFSPAPDTRSIRDTLVHIALSTELQSYVHRHNISDMQSVNFQELMQKYGEEQAKPRSKADIIALLTAEGDKFAGYLEALSESFLAETVKMRPGMEPGRRSRFEMLLSAKEHEMHHRGQLMVMERMIGIVPHLTREFQERMARLQPVAAQR